MSIVITLSITSFILGLGFMISKLIVPSNLKHIPSPSALQWIKNIFENKPMDVKINEITTKTLNSIKIQRVWRLGKWGVIVSSPKAAKMIFNDTLTFPKKVPIDKMPNSLFANFMGVNVLFSNHDIWKRHRKVLNPPFKKQFEVSIFSDCAKQFFEVIDNNLNGNEVDVFKYMQRITMDAIGKGTLEVDFNSVVEDSVPFIDAFNKIVKGSLDPFYFVMPFLDGEWNPLRKDLFNTIKELEACFVPAVNAKKEALLKANADGGNNVATDLITLMLQANLSEEVKFTEKEIRDSVMILLVAGLYSSPFAMSGVLHHLAQNQEAQDEARKEILRVMQLENYKNESPESCPVPTIDQIKEMEYLTAVLKENLRLYPSFSRLPTRLTSQEVTIDGYKVPKDTEVILDIYSMHRDPDNFNRANEFLPERFMKDSDISKLDKEKVDVTAWTPFGGGSRLCLGMNFALLELKVFLSMILLRYKISYPESYAESNGAPMKVSSLPVFIPTNLNLNFELIKD